MLKLSRCSTNIILGVSLIIFTLFGQSDRNIINTHTIPSGISIFDNQLTDGNKKLLIRTSNIDILGATDANPFEVNKLNYPGYDTLYWHDYSPSGGGYTIMGYQAGFGVKLSPEYYPAVIAGVHHRVFRLNRDSIQIRFVDDNGAGGAPLTTLYKIDTVTTNYTSSFVYHALPAPTCTIWDGKFYLFMLGNTHDNTIYLLNWLRDPALNAPTGYHWRHDTLGNYTSWEPAGDLEMGVVVEYHDVSIDSLSGLPANDTVFIDSTYSINVFCQELAGFSESNVPVLIDIGGVYKDTGYLSFIPNGNASTTVDWTVNLPESIYSCTCYIALSSDSRKINDTLLFNILVTTSASIVSRTKLEDEFKLVIAPNPAVNVALVRYNLPAAGRVACKVYNVNGTLIKSYTKTITTKKGVFLVNELPVGVYILRFNSGDMMVTRKLIFEK